MPERSPNKFMPSSPPATEQPESIWKLGGLSLWQLTQRVVRRIRDDDLLGRASELAFNFLLALFPLLLFMLALFGLFASRSAELQNSLLFYFADFLPPGAFQLLKEIINELATNAAGGKLTAGIALALWFASGGMSSMISILNAAYGVRESRPWLRMQLLALGLTISISILLLGALFIVLAGGNIADWIGAKLQLMPTIVLIWKGVQWIAAVGFVILSFSLVYYCGPTFGKRRWYSATPGSIFGALLWLIASTGFRAYLYFFNNYTETYGSLGALMILVVWLYVISLAFLVGGLINAETERASAAARDSQLLPGVEGTGATKDSLG
jgi:membrane protein